MMTQCLVSGCEQSITRKGHSLCYPHWKAQQSGKVKTCGSCDVLHEGDLCPNCDDNPADTLGPASLTSTKLGESLGVSSRKMNLILSELGWIEKYTKGWTPTRQGNDLGAELKTARSGVPYVIWPESIKDNKALTSTFQSLKSPSSPATESEEQTAEAIEVQTTKAGSDFRSRFPAKIRTHDGHMVRSRAEAMIDNYLYLNQIIHAYERKLPIEEDAYCDFYLPAAKLYIEFWGLEDKPAYRERKQTKLTIYEKYGMNLIELTDKEIENLDDNFPRLLLPYGIDCT